MRLAVVAQQPEPPLSAPHPSERMANESSEHQTNPRKRGRPRKPQQEPLARPARSHPYVRLSKNFPKILPRPNLRQPSTLPDIQTIIPDAVLIKTEQTDSGRVPNTLPRPLKPQSSWSYSKTAIPDALKELELMQTEETDSRMVTLHDALKGHPKTIQYHFGETTEKPLRFRPGLDDFVHANEQGELPEINLRVSASLKKAIQDMIKSRGRPRMRS